MSDHHFTSRPDRLPFYYFTISFPLGSRQEVFASRAAKPECRTTITGRRGRLLFYYFNFHWVPGRRFLHLGPQNLNVGPPFSPGGRRRLLFYYFTISFPLGSRQEVFASRAAKPECRTTSFTGRPDRLLFYYFTISFPLGSRQEVFASRPQNLNVRPIFTGRPAVFASRAAKPECRTTIFTGRPDRLPFYYFTISSPLGSRQEFFASRAAEPECRTTITGQQAVFASRAAKPECRTTIFTSRPDRLPFYYFTISFPLGSRQEVFASRAAKPECRTTISPVGGAVYYFTISISIEFQARGSCISGRKT